MCGIAGLLCSKTNEHSLALGRMVDALHHRGPDGRGIHVFDRCMLGHARLSIVDIAGGAQPMLSPSGEVGITFNGEIYGFKAIRSTLDYPYRTHSDTEVILALYEKYGEDLLSRLPGMFSFALWDSREQVLFCARDRFGEKPFYYAWGDRGEFIFASEIKAILATGLLTPRLDKVSLNHYLQRLYVPVDRSIYENIHSLPPAHYLKVKEGRLTVVPYWQLPLRDASIGPDEARDRFKDLLSNAVKRQLVADVEVGAFLSGGLDSSTIVSIAKEFSPDLQTISYGFEAGVNELSLARETARKYATRHTELVDRSAPIADLLVKMASVYDEPFADSSNIPTYLISHRASSHAKVVLTGDGGDELLGGYSWYRQMLLSGEKDPIPFYGLFLNACRLARKFHLPLSSDLTDAIWGRRMKCMEGNLLERHWRNNTYFSRAQMSRLGIDALEPCRSFGSLSGTLDDALRADVTDYMPGDILVKIDRASMANSLELRAPFLDVDLASFCISLPYNLKVSTSRGKELLRSAFASRWTEGVASAPKRGFGAPVEAWLKRPDVMALQREYLSSPDKKIFQLLDPRGIKRFSMEGSYRTWILLCLAIWMEKSAI